MTSHMILVVDDSRVSRMLVRAIIDHDNEQIQVIEAGNGEEALSKTQDIQVTIAILDLNMPGMDGLVLASKLLARFPRLKIVSAFSQGQNRFINGQCSRHRARKSSRIGYYFYS